MASVTARIATGIAALAAAAFLGACDSSSSGDQHAGHGGTTVTQAADHNVDDVTFARNMVPHHEQSVEMSQMVPTNTANPRVIALANQIISEQTPQIHAFNAWLMQWDQGSGEGHDGRGATGMTGMVDPTTMGKLKSLRGPEFDHLWLQSMITHHRGAVSMAQDVIAHGQNPDVIDMAKSITSSQQAEIDKMNQMLGG